MFRLHDYLQEHIRVLNVLGEYIVENILIAATELKLDEGTKQRLTKHRNNCENASM